MPDDDIIPAPEGWNTLSAAGTRFGLLTVLYQLIHWDLDVQFSKGYRTQFVDYWHFFFDDFVFKDNPQCMVGQSLFQDELPYLARLIEVFEPFADAVPDEFLTGPVDKSIIILPPIVIERATAFYNKLLEKGDPKIAQYRK